MFKIVILFISLFLSTSSYAYYGCTSGTNTAGVENVGPPGWLAYTCGGVATEFCHMGRCEDGFDPNKKGGDPASPYPRNPNDEVPPDTAAEYLNAALATVGLGAALLAGVFAVSAASPVLVAAAASVALNAAVLAAFGVSSAVSYPATAPAAVAAAAPPIFVSLTPSAEPPVPVPVTAPETPSVVSNEGGQFRPASGGLNTGGAEGGWSEGGASGEWSYTPPATVSNPTPQPSASITDNGYTFKQQTNPISSGAATKAIVVKRYGDGSATITRVAKMRPITSTEGLAA